jgi:hypothetical protein
MLDPPHRTVRADGPVGGGQRVSDSLPGMLGGSEGISRRRAVFAVNVAKDRRELTTESPIDNYWRL